MAQGSWGQELGLAYQATDELGAGKRNGCADLCHVVIL